MNPPNENHPLGQSISDIVDRTTTIVHEEIELAKSELAVSLQNLLRGSVAGIVGGVFAFFGLFVLLIGISFLISDLIDFGLWPGFLIVAFFLFVFGGLLAWVALKKIKKGSQLVPTQAIAEAKATQAALQPEPEVQRFDSVAVEDTLPPAAQTPSEQTSAEQPAASDAPAEVVLDAKTQEAADLLAAAKAVVEAPAAEQELPAPKFVTELPPGVDAASGKPDKQATKAQAKAAKQAAKAEAKAAQEAEKARAAAAKAAAKAEQEAEKHAAKAKKEAEKAAKKNKRADGDSAAPHNGDEIGDENGES